MLDFVAAFFDTILSIVPRLIKVRATHRGCVWPRCGKPRELKPGLHWVLPAWSEWELFPVARQSNILQPQSLILSDGTQVVLKGVVVFRIEDIVAAIGGKNFDCDTTVNDLALASISEVLSTVTKEDLKDLVGLNKKITRRGRQLLRGFGVYVDRIRLVDLTTCRTIRLLGHANI